MNEDYSDQTLLWQRIDEAMTQRRMDGYQSLALHDSMNTTTI